MSSWYCYYRKNRAVRIFHLVHSAMEVWITISLDNAVDHVLTVLIQRFRAILGLHQNSITFLETKHNKTATMIRECQCSFSKDCFIVRLLKVKPVLKFAVKIFLRIYQ